MTKAWREPEKIRFFFIVVCVFTPFAFRMVTRAKRLNFQEAEPLAAPLHLLKAKSLSDMFKGPKTFFNYQEKHLMKKLFG
ncbi:hypothetical protein BK126_26115 [Paenibacillus sp. FSL H7-0326]|nr:hypothetical protein BK126_26115 [Paenibacillus sp. FSL H7-0326]